MKVTFKKLHPDAVLPERAHKGDAGTDLYAVSDCIVPPAGRMLVGTGLAMQLPRSTEAQIRPRSGIALKHGVTVLNTPGTIDEGYRGEVGVILINHGSAQFEVKKGMKIAQMVLKPVYEFDVEEAEELDDTARGEGGFGSTGMQ